MIRCKFRCHHKEELKDRDGSLIAANIKMHPVYSETGENKEYWKYTPSGEISFNTINTVAASMIEIGKEYYVDISEA